MARTCRENCKLPRAGLRSVAHTTGGPQRTTARPRMRSRTVLAKPAGKEQKLNRAFTAALGQLVTLGNQTSSADVTALAGLLKAARSLPKPLQGIAPSQCRGRPAPRAPLYRQADRQRQRRPSGRTLANRFGERKIRLRAQSTWLHGHASGRHHLQLQQWRVEGRRHPCLHAEFDQAVIKTTKEARVIQAEQFINSCSFDGYDG